MASLQSSPSVYRTLFHGPYPQKHRATISCCRRGVLFLVKAEKMQTCSKTSHSQDGRGRRQVLTAGAIVSWVSMLNQNCVSFAAENTKGFLPVLDRKDGYEFLYPFGWQEVAIGGQDKVFKDVIEPLESVSVNMIPTGKESIRDFGSPQEVAETLIKKVLAPSTQKTKLIQAAERDVDGRVYYTFEFTAQAPTYTRHALSTICIGNGRFYTLTTGANERRWDKMKDRLQTVVDSFKVFNVV